MWNYLHIFPDGLIFMGNQSNVIVLSRYVIVLFK